MVKATQYGEVAETPESKMAVQPYRPIQEPRVEVRAGHKKKPIYKKSLIKTIGQNRIWTMALVDEGFDEDEAKSIIKTLKKDEVGQALLGQVKRIRALKDVKFAPDYQKRLSAMRRHVSSKVNGIMDRFAKITQPKPQGGTMQPYQEVREPTPKQTAVQPFQEAEVDITTLPPPPPRTGRGTSQPYQPAPKPPARTGRGTLQPYRPDPYAKLGEKVKETLEARKKGSKTHQAFLKRKQKAQRGGAGVVQPATIEKPTEKRSYSIRSEFTKRQRERREVPSEIADELIRAQNQAMQEEEKINSEPQQLSADPANGVEDPNMPMAAPEGSASRILTKYRNQVKRVAKAVTFKESAVRKAKSLASKIAKTSKRVTETRGQQLKRALLGAQERKDSADKAFIESQVEANALTYEKRKTGKKAEIEEELNLMKKGDGISTNMREPERTVDNNQVNEGAPSMEERKHSSGESIAQSIQVDNQNASLDQVLITQAPPTRPLAEGVTKGGQVEIVDDYEPSDDEYEQAVKAPVLDDMERQFGAEKIDDFQAYMESEYLLNVNRFQAGQPVLPAMQMLENVATHSELEFEDAMELAEYLIKKSQQREGLYEMEKVEEERAGAWKSWMTVSTTPWEEEGGVFEEEKAEGKLQETRDVLKRTRQALSDMDKHNLKWAKIMNGFVRGDEDEESTMRDVMESEKATDTSFSPFQRVKEGAKKIREEAAAVAKAGGTVVSGFKQAKDIYETGTTISSVFKFGKDVLGVGSALGRGAFQVTKGLSALFGGDVATAAEAAGEFIGIMTQLAATEIDSTEALSNIAKLGKLAMTTAQIGEILVAPELVAPSLFSLLHPGRMAEIARAGYDDISDVFSWAFGQRKQQGLITLSAEEKVSSALEGASNATVYTNAEGAQELRPNVTASQYNNAGDARYGGEGGSGQVQAYQAMDTFNAMQEEEDLPLANQPMDSSGNAVEIRETRPLAQIAPEPQVSNALQRQTQPITTRPVFEGFGGSIPTSIQRVFGGNVLQPKRAITGGGDSAPRPGAFQGTVQPFESRPLLEQKQKEPSEESKWFVGQQPKPPRKKPSPFRFAPPTKPGARIGLPFKENRQAFQQQVERYTTALQKAGERMTKKVGFARGGPSLSVFGGGGAKKKEEPREGLLGWLRGEEEEEEKEEGKYSPQPRQRPWPYDPTAQPQIKPLANFGAAHDDTLYTSGGVGQYRPNIPMALENSFPVLSASDRAEALSLAAIQRWEPYSIHGNSTNNPLIEQTMLEKSFQFQDNIEIDVPNPHWSDDPYFYDETTQAMLSKVLNHMKAGDQTPQPMNPNYLIPKNVQDDMQSVFQQYDFTDAFPTNRSLNREIKGRGEHTETRFPY